MDCHPSSLSGAVALHCILQNWGSNCLRQTICVSRQVLFQSCHRRVSCCSLSAVFALTGDSFCSETAYFLCTTHTTERFPPPAPNPHKLILTVALPLPVGQFLFPPFLLSHNPSAQPPPHLEIKKTVIQVYLNLISSTHEIRR